MTDIRIPEANSREVARSYREGGPDLPVPVCDRLCRADAACAWRGYHLGVRQGVLGIGVLGTWRLARAMLPNESRNLYGGVRKASATERRRLRNHGQAKERASPAVADRDCVHGDPLRRPGAVVLHS